MKKKNVWRKILSLILAMVFCVSMPLAVLAEEQETPIIEEIIEDMIGVEDSESSDGKVVDVETTAGNTEPVDVVIKIEEVTTPEGNSGVQITAEAENVVTESSLIVDFEGSADLESDEDGNVTGSAETEYSVISSDGQYEAEGGSKKEFVESAPQVRVDVPLTEGATETATGDEVGTSSTTGDVPESEDDGVYDYTTETVVQQGSVEVSNVEISTEILNDEEKQHGYENDLDYIESTVTPTETNDLFNFDGTPANTDNLPEGTEGYDYVLAGNGNVTQIRPAIVFSEEMTDEEMSETKIGHSNVYMWPGYLNKYLQYNPNFDTSDIKRNADGSFAKDEEGHCIYNDGTKVRTEDLPALNYDDKTQITGPEGEEYYLGRSDLISDTRYVEGWYQESYYDEEGNFHEGEWVDPINGEKRSASYATAQQFVLVDKTTGEVITTYCADQETRTQEFYGYNMENLEDADYYNDEQAAQIRTIALNGYWGTEGTELDESGNTVPATGSLDAMKDMMRSAVDEEGNRIFTDEEIDNSLTDGVALSATQMAIWSCSNKMDGVQFVNAHYVNPENDALGDVPEAKEDEVELTFKLYEYLKNMEPTEAEATSSETVITAENAVKDLSVTVVDKAEGHANNLDDDNNNDAYVTDVSFALIVTPSTENGDDMIVKVVSNGEVLKEARIAGEAKEGETLESLSADENGNYTIQNVTLIEGNQEFNISLEGIQNLDEGVYLFTSEVQTIEEEEVSSQTMVGLAKGEHAVNVSMTYAFDLYVEDEVSLIENYFRNEWYDYTPVYYDYDPDPTPTPTPTPVPDPTPTPDPESTPAPDPTSTPDPDPTSTPDPKPTSESNPTPKPKVKDEPKAKDEPKVVRVVIEAREVVIPDEMVPLAAAPETGDASMIYAAMAIISAAGLVVMALTRKREKA